LKKIFVLLALIVFIFAHELPAQTNDSVLTAKPAQAEKFDYLDVRKYITFDSQSFAKVESQ
jgi:hypothetical protein